VENLTGGAAGRGPSNTVVGPPARGPGEGDSTLYGSLWWTGGSGGPYACRVGSSGESGTPNPESRRRDAWSDAPNAALVEGLPNGGGCDGALRGRGSTTYGFWGPGTPNLNLRGRRRRYLSPFLRTQQFWPDLRGGCLEARLGRSGAGRGAVHKYGPSKIWPALWGGCLEDGWDGTTRGCHRQLRSPERKGRLHTIRTVGPHCSESRGEPPSTAGRAQGERTALLLVRSTATL
jgi:hypothetical protein